jgi:hypothetical protein
VLLMTLRPDRTESFAVLATSAAAGLFSGIIMRNAHRAIRPGRRVEKPEAL